MTTGSAGSSISVLPGPDRGEGGKYLILPPGYDGPVPEGGFYVARARTTLVIWFARSFLENNDPKPVAESIKKVHQGLSLRGRRRRHPHRRVPERQGQTRKSHAAAADRVPRRHRQGDEHDPAQRLQLLRDAQRGRAAGACNVARPRVDGPDRRHRHHQGQTLRAGCADEEDSHRSAGARQCHLAHPVYGSSRSGLGTTTPARVGRTCCSQSATSSRRRSR